MSETHAASIHPDFRVSILILARFCERLS